MLELIFLLIAILYGRCKGYSDALRDYKLDMKAYVKSLQDPTDASHKRAWLVGGDVWDSVRKCKLPVFCADAWHFYDGTKYLILSLQLMLGWFGGMHIISTLLPYDPFYVIPALVIYIWVGWWVAGLTFALYYHHYLIDPDHSESPNVRYFGVWFLIVNSIKFWDPLPSQA